MSNTPTVWVCKEQVSNGNAMDYSPATAYGELEFITQFDIPLHRAIGSTIALRWDGDVEKFVRLYQEDRDFIICTGQPTAIFAIGWALGRMEKLPRFLVWRREENRYRVLDLVPQPV